MENGRTFFAIVIIKSPELEPIHMLLLGKADISTFFSLESLVWNRLQKLYNFVSSLCALKCSFIRWKCKLQVEPASKSLKRKKRKWLAILQFIQPVSFGSWWFFFSFRPRIQSLEENERPKINVYKNGLLGRKGAKGCMCGVTFWTKSRHANSNYNQIKPHDTFFSL